MFAELNSSTSTLTQDFFLKIVLGAIQTRHKDGFLTKLLLRMVVLLALALHLHLDGIVQLVLCWTAKKGKKGKTKSPNQFASLKTKNHHWKSKKEKKNRHCAQWLLNTKLDSSFVWLLMIWEAVLTWALFFDQMLWTLRTECSFLWGFDFSTKPVCDKVIITPKLNSKYWFGDFFVRTCHVKAKENVHFNPKTKARKMCSFLSFLWVLFLGDIWVSFFLAGWVNNSSWSGNNLTFV